MGPWTCPKCGRVWGPGTSSCKPCNDRVAAREARGFTIKPPSRGTMVGGYVSLPAYIRVMN